MGEAAKQEVPDWPAPDFVSTMEAAEKWRKENRIPELLEEEATELAVAEVRAYRAERASVYKP